MPRSNDRPTRWASAAGVLLATLLAMVSLAPSAQAASVPLGTADSFAVLAGSTVTNTGFTLIEGDVGVSPGSAVTGFAPGTVIAPGRVHAADSVAARAKTDLATAYSNAAQRTSTATISSDLAGRTLRPGVYTSASSLGLNGDLTLDARGDPNAVFVFQARSTLLVGSNAVGRVLLAGGAQACNVFWQVGSSATIGGGSAFVGNILARTSISLKTNALLKGRALAHDGAVTLETNRVSKPVCVTKPAPGGGATQPKPCTVGSTSRRPARPVLLSPRRGAHVRAGNVRFRWRAAPRTRRYKLIVGRQEINTGCATKAVMHINPGRHKWRVTAIGPGGRRSSMSRRFTARTSFTGTSADEITRRSGLDALRKEVVVSAERITLKAAQAAAFRKALKGVGKVASKAFVVGILIDLGLSDGDLDCEQGPLYSRSRPVFAAAGKALSRAARARVGPQPGAKAKITAVRRDLRELRKFIDGNDTVKECSGPNKVALEVIKKLGPALNAAEARLDRRAVKPSKDACNTAKKLLKEYARIFEKVTKKPLKRTREKELDRKRDAGTITSNDLPGPLMRRFPGELKGFTLKEIKELCR